MKNDYSTTQQIALQLRQLYFGGNWSSSNLKDNTSDLTWEQATRSISSLNSIAKLVYHIDYYVRAQIKVLKGGQLDTKDAYSFDLSPINSEEEWKQLLENIFRNGEILAGLIEQFPEVRLGEYFTDARYGTYFRNFTGLIEHAHYHLGQIALIKKTIEYAILA